MRNDIVGYLFILIVISIVMVDVHAAPKIPAAAERMAISFCSKGSLGESAGMYQRMSAQEKRLTAMEEPTTPSARRELERNRMLAQANALLALGNLERLATQCAIIRRLDFTGV